MTGITAVVATYKRHNELKRLLDSILLNEKAIVQVIIVDQNTDGLVDELILDYKLRMDILQVKLEQPNQSKARNYGASLAKYDILCFPDDDCWFECDSLEKVSSYFTSEKGTDLLIINWNQNPVKIQKSFVINKKEMFSFRSVGYVTYVLFFKTCCFLELGGFLETIGIGMYIGGGEDSELAFRAISKQYKLFYNSGIYVNHNYINIYSRPLPVLRARQRAMGLMYYLYKIPVHVIIRGLLSPLFKMLIALDPNKIKQHYNMFLARIEGYKYGLRNKKNIQQSIKPIKNN